MTCWDIKKLSSKLSTGSIFSPGRLRFETLETLADDTMDNGVTVWTSELSVVLICWWWSTLELFELCWVLSRIWEALCISSDEVFRCLTRTLPLVGFPLPKWSNSKCLLRFLDCRSIAPHRGHVAGWSDMLRAFEPASPENYQIVLKSVSSLFVATADKNDWCYWFNE